MTISSSLILCYLQGLEPDILKAAAAAAAVVVAVVAEVGVADTARVVAEVADVVLADAAAVAAEDIGRVEEAEVVDEVVVAEAASAETMALTVSIHCVELN